MSSADTLIYEFPCNEKVRTYLRLELLFRRYDWFCTQDEAIAHQSAISALFDLLDATARSDLRNELLQELERQRQRLQSLEGNIDIRQDALAQTLAEITDAIDAVSNTVGKTGQSVRENQWLQLIRTRQNIVGGTCEFDLPQLHKWLNESAQKRRNELLGYIAPLDPIRKSISILLRFLRATAQVDDYVAKNGTFQLPTNGRQSFSLAQIWLPAQGVDIPEVSANKYMLWIRFSRPDHTHKLHPVRHEDIPFRMALCALN